MVEVDGDTERKGGKGEEGEGEGEVIHCGYLLLRRRMGLLVMMMGIREIRERI